MESSREAAHGSRATTISGSIMFVAIVVVCLIILFLIFLHLYAKWFWWQIDEPPAPRQLRRRPFVFAAGQETSLCTRASRGLDPAVLGSLPVILFHKKEFRDEDGLECAVCLCEVVDGEMARVLSKCNHGFHVDCIDMWFQSHVTCPLCRNPVVGGESVSSDSVESGNVVDNGLVHNAGTENLGSGYLIETPRFPANVLFWGNGTQVNSFVACLEESGSGSVPVSPSWVIDVSMDDTDNENVAEEESKSPMPTRLKTLKRLLSRERRIASTSSSSSPDVC